MKISCSDLAGNWRGLPSFGGGGGRMSSPAAVETDADAPDLVCELDSIRGIVDALSSVRWKRLQVLFLFFFYLSLAFFLL